MTVKSLLQSSLKNDNYYRSMLVGNPGFDTSFELLETQVLGSNAASITFSNLSNYASTYQHLQIRAVARGTRNANGDNLSMRFNGDSGSNYVRHAVYGQGTAVESYSAINNSFVDLGTLASATTPANVFTAAVTDILDPFETTKNTTVRSLNGLPAAGLFIGTASGAWLSTSALTSLTIFAVSGSLTQYSRFSLYGVKAA